MGQTVYESKLNPENGNSELWCRGEMIAESDYHGIASYEEGEYRYIVFSSYWEGVIPSQWIGKALRVSSIS